MTYLEETLTKELEELTNETISLINLCARHEIELVSEDSTSLRHHLKAVVQRERNIIAHNEERILVLKKLITK